MSLSKPKWLYSDHRFKTLSSLIVPETPTAQLI